MWRIGRLAFTQHHTFKVHGANIPRIPFRTAVVNIPNILGIPNSDFVCEYVAMTRKPILINVRMHDGSRHFLSLPQSRSWYAVRDYVAKLDSAILTDFLCDEVTEAWIDFTFAHHTFTINNQFGEYWFFVKDCECPDSVLQSVAEHFNGILRETAYNKLHQITPRVGLQWSIRIGR